MRGGVRHASPCWCCRMALQILLASRPIRILIVGPIFSFFALSPFCSALADVVNTSAMNHREDTALIYAPRMLPGSQMLMLSALYQRCAAHRWYTFWCVSSRPCWPVALPDRQIPITLTFTACLRLCSGTMATMEYTAAIRK